MNNKLIEKLFFSISHHKLHLYMYIYIYIYIYICIYYIFFNTLYGETLKSIVGNGKTVGNIYIFHLVKHQRPAFQASNHKNWHSPGLNPWSTVVFTLCK